MKKSEDELSEKSQSQNQKKQSRKKSERSEKKSKRRRNHEFMVVTYAFVGIFAVMIGYFIYFEAVLSPDVINNPYNSRQETFEEHVVRGSILSSDGSVLAETIVGSDGTETRSYPYANLFSHVVGYSTRGESGIESLANFNLLTSNANLGEQIVNDLKEEKNIGDNVVTTLDVELQQTAYLALGNSRGAVVVLEADTGKVLAMVSKPDFDPNKIGTQWESLTSGSDGVLYNRAAQGLYAPGSTFKIVTLLEYMRENENYENFYHNCTGSVTAGNYTINCFNGSSHGQEDLKKAFAKSCNTAFATIGLSLDPARFTATCESLLFNTELPFELSSSMSSFSLSDSSAESIQMMTAIGQGETVVTPLHMAMITEAVANDGVMMTPMLLERVESHTGNTVKTYRPSAYASVMTSDEAAVLTEYMKEVVNSGTGSALSDLGFSVAGKTGTAEYSSDKNKSHAWFVGFSDTGDSDIVVCVLVEEKGSGSEYAVPIARQIFNTWAAEKLEF